MALRTSTADASYKRVKDTLTSQGTPYNLHANAMAFAQRRLCAPAKLLLYCRRPYCAAMMTLRGPHCALIITLKDGVCFEHAQSARRPSAFYAIPQRLLATPLQ